MVNLIYITILAFFIFLVYISGKNNHTNLWCVCAGLLLSLGVIKELFFYNAAPYLELHFDLSSQTAADIYSILTWILYTFAMSACVMFAMNFAGIPTSRPAIYRGFQLTSVLCILFFSIRFTPLEFRVHQMEDPQFWLFCP